MRYEIQDSRLWNCQNKENLVVVLRRGRFSNPNSNHYNFALIIETWYLLICIFFLALYTCLPSPVFLSPVCPSARLPSPVSRLPVSRLLSPVFLLPSARLLSPVSLLPSNLNAFNCHHHIPSHHHHDWCLVVQTSQKFK